VAGRGVEADVAEASGATHAVPVMRARRWAQVTRLVQRRISLDPPKNEHSRPDGNGLLSPTANGYVLPVVVASFDRNDLPLISDRPSAFPRCEARLRNDLPADSHIRRRSRSGRLASATASARRDVAGTRSSVRTPPRRCETPRAGPRGGP
jgi:hypothetical protein